MKHATLRPRGGTILICILACLVVVTAVIGSATQAALRDRQATRVLRQLRQTELLLEAGVLRAAQQLKASSSYEGEQWSPQLFAASPNDSATRSQGDEETGAEATVEIRVTPNDDVATRHVEVIAKLDSPASRVGTLQRSHQFTFEIPATSSSENQ